MDNSNKIVSDVVYVCFSDHDAAAAAFELKDFHLFKSPFASI